MAILDGRTWMEHLSEQTCWQLLSSTTLGRIGVLVDSSEVDPGAPGAKQHWIRVVPTAVTGRRVRLPDVRLDPLRASTSSNALAHAGRQLPKSHPSPAS